MPGLKSSVRKAALAATHVAAALPSLPTTRRKEGTRKIIEREGKQAILWIYLWHFRKVREIPSLF